jgi:hypothetical protein
METSEQNMKEKQEKTRVNPRQISQWEESWLRTGKKFWSSILFAAFLFLFIYLTTLTVTLMV